MMNIFQKSAPEMDKTNRSIWAVFAFLCKVIDLKNKNDIIVIVKIRLNCIDRLNIGIILRKVKGLMKSGRSICSR